MIRHAGVIAAGDGLRLQGAIGATVKPMAPVAGVPLVHWVVRSLRGAGIESFTVILNSRGNAARESLVREFPAVSWTFLVQDTASSWESFRLVAQALSQKADIFLMSTVDALMPPQEAERFAREAATSPAPAGLALTSFMDDEKPLWAELGENGLVSALGPSCRSRSRATAGLYFLTKAVADAMPAAERHSKLRDYWQSLLDSKTPVAGIALGKTLDVDRPRDLAAAERFATW
ncbi:MAG: NTP transferase domain-containing protein [Elusimicrobia bacterium]|nr:NTP transferase domain-containing protein [Elusimicrobiota bacterium]